MENRRSGVLKVWLWWLWLAAMLAISAEPFRWEVEYFRIHGNSLYFHAIIGLLLLLIPACFFYVRWRSRGWYRYELPAIAGAAIVLAAIEQPRAFAAGTLFFMACLTAGQTLGRLLGIAFENPAAAIGIGFAAGSAALIPVLFILGLLHAYYWPVFLLLLLAPLAFAWRDAFGGLRAIARLWQAAGNLPALKHPLCGVGVLFLAAGVLCGTIAALAPSIVMDAVKMHLPDAQSYLAMHALQPVSVSSYSYYPQGFEVLLTLAYSLGGQPAAQMVTPMFLAALLLVLFEIVKLCGFDAAGIFTGLAAVVMTPFILWDGSQVKNDTELALFQLAALYCCLRWRSTERRPWLMLGAFLLAGSFGIKHIAAFGAVPLVLLFIAPLYRKPRAIRTAALFFVCLAVFGFYWHLRTYLLTGDPLYPRHVAEAVTPRVNFLRNHDTWIHRRLIDLWLVQLHDTRVGLESPLRSPMGIVLLALAPLALLAARKRNSNRIACWFYIAAYLLLWGARMTTLRYALAPIALLIALVATKTKEAYEQHWAMAPRVVRFSIASAFAGALAYGLLGAILLEIVPGQLPLLAHRIRPADYLRSNLPGYAALASFGRLGPHTAVLQINACDRAYTSDPTDSMCITGAPGERREQHSQRLWAAHHFQYAVLPAYWDAAARATFFQGWSAQQVYAGKGWSGFKISPNP
ncbi:MAG TPA: hypothetical protein VME17_15615 [Bryobacteraceae bacterium]|nr:hypothetical protein [Bryobacteraceae bacterium]